jgi:hypothetical protein
MKQVSGYAPIDETADSPIDITPFRTAPWTRYVTQPFFIAILITCLATSVLVVIGSFADPIPWRALILLSFIVALESIYTTFWLRDPDRRLLSNVAYRAAELVLILLITRFFTWAAAGNWPTGERLRDIQQSPIELFDPYFIIAFLLMIFIWQQAAITAKIFDRLAISDSEATFHALPFSARKALAEDRPARLFRAGLVREFFQRWVWGGVGLAVFTALGTLDLAPLQDGSFSSIVSLGLRPELLTALMAYFIVGFWLLSQARLAMLNARWLAEDVIKDEELAITWRRRSLAVLLGIALLVAFVPIGSTMPIGRILDLVVYGVVYVAGLVFYIVAFLFIAILSLLGRSREGADPEELPPLEEIAPPPEPPPSPLPPSEATTLLLGMIFWSVMLTVTIVALAFYLRERGYTFNVRLLRTLWQDFVSWLGQIGLGFRLRIDDLWPSRQVREKKETAVSTTSSTPWWQRLWPGKLSPRERVRYYYLALVRQAGDAGVARQQHETPLEYERPLHDAWPETDREIEAMTQAFLHARYSRRPVDDEEAAMVEETWKTLKPRLKQPLPDSDTERQQEMANDEDSG